MTKLLLRLADRFVKLGPGRGGLRPGAGRKPSTIEGILKRLPPEAAELLIREIKAKAELIQVQIKFDLLSKAKVPREISASALDGNQQSISNIASPTQQGLGLSEKQVKSDRECRISQGPEKNNLNSDGSLVSTNTKQKRAVQCPPTEQVAAKSATLAYLSWKARRLKQADKGLLADRRRT
jgi:hypothetical protein